ncbi:WAT1-related protein At3g30340 [Dendrobium catenatum]|uniref:WAT1-related protein n=1 Tax=Dendrobium catenatum TaxID=906689 RepID=A0A2I0WS80_9ASPA|nr:WAT1-related protein At3g30340 [Dendrobium catenatum]PKU78532.1 WAT1-related protein [Dendrobium catenatum]
MGWKPVVVMVLVSLAFAVMNVMVKKAIDEGMNRLVLIILRQLVAALFMAPVAYVCERKAILKLTTEIFMYIFISALLGVSLTQYLFFIGLQYTSATFACAFLNMVPVTTFLMALPFRLERVDLKTKAGMMKIMGATVCVAGALLLTLYKGMALSSPSHSFQSSQHKEAESINHTRTWKWILGSFALFGACSSWSSWFLVQSKILKIYPALYTSTTVMFFQSFLQVSVLNLVTQRRASVWAFSSKLEIATVLYSGLMGSGICLLASSWCIKQKGPVFTAAFNPLTQFIVGAIDLYILGEPLHLGSLLGSILVIFGLYILLWGKSKEAHGIEVKQIEGGRESKESIEAV